jgi:hypothetical protein
MPIVVHADWESDAEVLVAASDAVPGLIAEAATPAELLKKLDVLVPELRELHAALNQTGPAHRF